jgi:hypothetical protein
MILLMMMIFLIGTTGVSFYIHECRSSNTREVFAFPEIIKYQSSCSCDDEMQATASSGFEPMSVSEQDCCKNTHLYLKASFIGFPVLSGIKQNLVEEIIISDLSFSPVNCVSEQKLIIPFSDHSPPPLFGRLLIQAIHQLKIPVTFS